MAKVSDIQGILRQTSIDAGCDRELVGRCITSTMDVIPLHKLEQCFRTHLK